MVEEAKDGPAEDAARFDEILVCVAGAEGPEELQVAEQPLPLDRESALAMAEDAAADEVDEAWNAREADSEAGLLSDEEHAAYRYECLTAAAAARTEAAARWDAWFARACDTVDCLLGQAETPPANEPEPAPSPAAAVDAPAEGAADSSPRTVSEVSGSAGAATFVGPDGRRYAHA